MPVQIDEISAEVAPAANESAPTPSAAGGPPSPEIELRQQRDLIARLEARAMRIHAD
jgi:hypothetical protein